MTSELPDNPGVIAKPPSLALGALAIGGVLELLAPSHVPGGWLRVFGGVALVAAGAVLVATAMRQFRTAGTNFETDRPSETVVSHGLYAISRNPIYIGLCLILVGIGLAAGSLWVIGMVAPLVLVLRFGVIAREERYLERKFGQRYTAYRARVRRWI